MWWGVTGVRRWAFLHSLTLVILLAALEDSRGWALNLPCCNKASAVRKIEGIKLCYEQRPRNQCMHRAVLIITEDGRKVCVSPHLPWLRKLQREEKLACEPEFTYPLINLEEQDWD